MGAHEKENLVMILVSEIKAISFNIEERTKNNDYILYSMKVGRMAMQACQIGPADNVPLVPESTLSGPCRD